MNIETIDDILNELADKLYVYGCCKAAANVEALQKAGKLEYVCPMRYR